MWRKCYQENQDQNPFIPFNIIQYVIPHGLKNKIYVHVLCFVHLPCKVKIPIPSFLQILLEFKGKVLFTCSLMILAKINLCPHYLVLLLHIHLINPPILPKNFHKNKYAQALTIYINEVSPIRAINESIDIKMNPKYETLVHVSHSKDIDILNHYPFTSSKSILCPYQSRIKPFNLSLILGPYVPSSYIPFTPNSLSNSPIVPQDKQIQSFLESSHPSKLFISTLSIHKTQAFFK